MKFIEDTKEYKKLITDFLKSKNFAVKSVLFYDDCVVVRAAEKGENKFLENLLSGKITRDVNVINYLKNVFETYEVFDKKFVIGDFTFKSVYDLDEESHKDFSQDWRFTLSEHLKNKASAYVEEIGSLVTTDSECK